MPHLRNHTSRRAPPLKDSDYDHEINLVDHEESSASSPTDSRPGTAAADAPAVTVTAEQSMLPGVVHVVDAPPVPTLMTASPASHRPQPTVSLGAAVASAAAAATALSAASAVTAEPTSAVDILYENERGGFLCGIALFSGRALGNLDPSPWTNANHKTSPTDIHTAQVPDPSWQWAWPAWRVRPTEHADADGWEYSFMFARAFAWHGPTWYSSFVRRRVWIRRRVKRSAAAAAAATAASLAVPGPAAVCVSGDDTADAGNAVAVDAAAVEAPNLLNPDYFVVLPAAEMRRSSSRASHHSGHTHRGSTANRSSLSLVPRGQRDEAASENGASAGASAAEKDGGPAMPAVISDADALLEFLYEARIDREKIDAVDNYIAHAGEDLVRLQDIMHKVMAQFVFQAPRRLLLSNLQAAYEAAKSERAEIQLAEAITAEAKAEAEAEAKAKAETAEAETETKAEQTESKAEQTEAGQTTQRLQALGRRIGYLAAAVRHADEEVHRLEYWSDVQAVHDAPAED